MKKWALSCVRARILTLVFMENKGRDQYVYSFKHNGTYKEFKHKTVILDPASQIKLLCSLFPLFLNLYFIYLFLYTFVFVCIGFKCILYIIIFFLYMFVSYV